MSTTTKYTIPNEIGEQLRVADSKDERSDAEILAGLEQHVPVTSEKNLWAFWHAGVNAMPGWCQRNVTNWVRLNGPSWTVRILDAVPSSPKHFLRFVSADLLPETFVQGTMEGAHTGQHSSDFLKGALPYLHGGVFMDVGNILFRSLDTICWNVLASSTSTSGPRIAIPWMYGNAIANHFIAARKGDPFIKHWHDLFIFLWKDKTVPGDMLSHPLLQFILQHADFSESQRRGFKWDMAVPASVVFGYIAQVCAWWRLAVTKECEDGFKGYEYAQTRILYFDSREESWAAEAIVGFDGGPLFDALALPYTGPPKEGDSDEYKRAYQMLWRLLTGASLQKISHGKGITKQEALGTLWDKPENEGADVKEGSIAEVLREGSWRFEQLRESVTVVQIPEVDVLSEKGLYEA